MWTHCRDLFVNRAGGCKPEHRKYRKQLFTRPKDMTREYLYAFNNSRANLLGFGEHKTSQLIKQFCFAPNCKQEFISQHQTTEFRWLNRNHSSRTFLTECPTRPVDRPHLGELALISGWTPKAHVRRQQWWQMSAVPLWTKDCYVFIQCVEPPSWDQEYTTHGLLQLCLRDRSVLLGIIWELPNFVYQSITRLPKILICRKNNTWTFTPFFKTFVFNLRQFWSQSEVLITKLTIALGERGDML